VLRVAVSRRRQVAGRDAALEVGRMTRRAKWWLIGLLITGAMYAGAWAQQTVGGG
jgi:hypothetical protein